MIVKKLLTIKGILTYCKKSFDRKRKPLLIFLIKEVNNNIDLGNTTAMVYILLNTYKSNDSLKLMVFYDSPFPVSKKAMTKSWQFNEVEAMGFQKNGPLFFETVTFSTIYFFN